MTARGRDVAWAVLLALAVLAFVLFRIDENDPWWHLASGRHLWQTGRFPAEDPFSFLLPGKPWVDEYWLFQLLLLSLWNVGGSAALTLFKALLVTGIVLALGAIRRRQGLPWPVYGVLALVTLVALAERLVERPELVTWVCLLAFILLLPRGTAPPTRRALWLLPAIEILWANSHPAFLIGPVLVLICAAGQFLNLLWRREWRAKWPALASGQAALLALVISATFLNPYGWRLHLLPFELSGTGVFLERIHEWQRPWESLMISSRWAVPLMLLLALPPMMLTWRRRETVPLLWLAAFTLLGLQAVRHGALFAWVALAVATESWATWWCGRRTPRSLSAASAALLAGFAYASVTGWSWWALGSFRRFGLDPETWRYPGAECDFVLSQPLHGEMYNDYNIGGYLMWRLHPQHRVCTDGRLIVYGGDLISETLAITDGDIDWRPFFRRHGIHWALISTEAEVLATRLWQDPGWHLIFAGNRALVFAEEIPEHRALIERHGIGEETLSRLTSVEVTPRGPWWMAPQVPYAAMRRAATLTNFGRPDLALEVLEHLREVNPAEPHLQSAYPHSLLHGARVLMQRQEWPRAEQALRRLIEVEPLSVEAWNNLGVLLARTERPREARAAWERALTLDPSSDAVRQNLERLRRRPGSP